MDAFGASQERFPGKRNTRSESRGRLWGYERAFRKENVHLVCVSLGESHDHFLSRNRKLMHHMCKSAMSHEIETGDRASENEPRTADAR